MNMLPTLCNVCGTDMLIPQASWTDPFARICPKCLADDKHISDQLKEPDCDCGAIHTSFPNVHSSWCSVTLYRNKLEEVQLEEII